MRHALVIARRELVEKRFVAFAAAAFAVIPFLLAALPVIRGRSSAADVIATGAALLSMGFTGGLAMILGSTVIGRDLAEGRLSFYFARPIGAVAIWFGKVMAALALIAAAFLIIVLPARLAASSGFGQVWGKGTLSLTLVIIGASFLIFFVAHLVSSFIRSRSAWIGIDFALLFLAAAGTYALITELLLAGALRAMIVVASLIAAGLVVALIGGGAWQLERGRIDRKRSHLELSKFVWIAVAAGLALAAAFVGWLIAARPSDLKYVEALPQGKGPWLVVMGEARGRLDYRPAFAYNSETGAHSRLPIHGLNGRLMFTRDGNSLLLARYDRRTNTIELFKRALDRAEEVSTGLVLPLFYDMTPNDDGSRIVTVARGGMLNVYDITQHRSMVSARLPESAGYVGGMYFVSPALVRIYTVNRDNAVKVLRVFELDVPARALRQTGQFAAEGNYLGVTANEDGSRLFARSPKALHVIDGRTAAVQASIPGSFRGITFLRDGGIAVIHGASIEIRDAAGSVVRAIPMPAPNAWSLRELPDGNLVTLGQAEDRPESKPWHTYIIDSKSGALVQHIPAVPVGWRGDSGWLGHDPRRAPVALPTLFGDGRLLRWNYATKQAEVLLPKS